MQKLILISLFVFSFACSKGVNSNVDLKPNQTIIPVHEKMEWVFGKNYKPYSPTQEDIKTTESLLSECYTKETNRFSGRKLEDYNRQFVGAETESGDKVIWINCFCKAEINSFKNWKTDIFMVADGGNCFFKLNVNVTKKEYYSLSVNGTP